MQKRVTDFNGRDNYEQPELTRCRWVHCDRRNNASLRKSAIPWYISLPSNLVGSGGLARSEVVTRRGAGGGQAACGSVTPSFTSSNDLATRNNLSTRNKLFAAISLTD